MEFGEVVTQNSKRLKARSRIQQFFVLVPPLLKLLYVLVVGWFACEKGLTILFLVGSSKKSWRSSLTTYFYVFGHVVLHTGKGLYGLVRHKAIIF